MSLVDGLYPLPVVDLSDGDNPYTVCRFSGLEFLVLCEIFVAVKVVSV